MQAKTRDADYPTDLTTLARIQAELGQVDKAEANYLAAISAVEAAEGEFSLELLSPYRGLGRAYIRAGRYPEAITAPPDGARGEPAQPRPFQRRAVAAARRHHDGVPRARRHARSAAYSDRAARQRDQALRRDRSARDPVSLSPRRLLRALAPARPARATSTPKCSRRRSRSSARAIRRCWRRCASSCTSTCSPIRRSTAKRARASCRCSSRTRTRIRSSAACRSRRSATGRSSRATRTRRATTTNRPGRR